MCPARERVDSTDVCLLVITSDTVVIGKEHKWYRFGFGLLRQCEPRPPMIIIFRSDDRSIISFYKILWVVKLYKVFFNFFFQRPSVKDDDHLSGNVLFLSDLTLSLQWTLPLRYFRKCRQRNSQRTRRIFTVNVWHFPDFPSRFRSSENL